MRGAKLGRARRRVRVEAAAHKREALADGGGYGGAEEGSGEARGSAVRREGLGRVAFASAELDEGCVAQRLELVCGERPPRRAVTQRARGVEEARPAAHRRHALGMERVEHGVPRRAVEVAVVVPVLPCVCLGVRGLRERNDDAM